MNLSSTIAIFLPAGLLVLGAIPFWERIRQMPRAGAAQAGANAAVVGILGAALYTPVFTAGVSGVITLSIAVVCYAALTSWKVPPWAVVVGAAWSAGLCCELRSRPVLGAEARQGREPGLERHVGQHRAGGLRRAGGDFLGYED